MERLTFNQAKENGMSGIDCVKYYDSNLSNGQCDSILWGETCFPFDPEKTLEQLYSFFKNS